MRCRARLGVSANIDRRSLSGAALPKLKAYEDEQISTDQGEKDGAGAQVFIESRVHVMRGVRLPEFYGLSLCIQVAVLKPF